MVLELCLIVEVFHKIHQYPINNERVKKLLPKIHTSNNIPRLQYGHTSINYYMATPPLICYGQTSIETEQKFENSRILSHPIVPLLYCHTPLDIHVHVPNTTGHTYLHYFPFGYLVMS